MRLLWLSLLAAGVGAQFWGFSGNQEDYSDQFGLKDSLASWSGVLRNVAHRQLFGAPTPPPQEFQKVAPPADVEHVDLKSLHSHKKEIINEKLLNLILPRFKGQTPDFIRTTTVATTQKPAKQTNKPMKKQPTTLPPEDVDESEVEVEIAEKDIDNEIDGDEKPKTTKTADNTETTKEETTTTLPSTEASTTDVARTSPITEEPTTTEEVPTTQSITEDNMATEPTTEAKTEGHTDASTTSISESSLTSKEDSTGAATTSESAATTEAPSTTEQSTTANTPRSTEGTPAATEPTTVEDSATTTVKNPTTSSGGQFTVVFHTSAKERYDRNIEQQLEEKVRKVVKEIFDEQYKKETISAPTTFVNETENSDKKKSEIEKEVKDALTTDTDPKSGSSTTEAASASITTEANSTSTTTEESTTQASTTETVTTSSPETTTHKKSTVQSSTTETVTTLTPETTTHKKTNTVVRTKKRPTKVRKPKTTTPATESSEDEGEDEEEEEEANDEDEDENEDEDEDEDEDENEDEDEGENENEVDEEENVEETYVETTTKQLRRKDAKHGGKLRMRKPAATRDRELEELIPKGDRSALKVIKAIDMKSGEVDAPIPPHQSKKKLEELAKRKPKKAARKPESDESKEKPEELAKRKPKKAARKPEHDEEEDFEGSGSIVAVNDEQDANMITSTEEAMSEETLTGDPEIEDGAGIPEAEEAEELEQEDERYLRLHDAVTEVPITTTTAGTAGQNVFNLQANANSNADPQVANVITPIAGILDGISPILFPLLQSRGASRVAAQGVQSYQPSENRDLLENGTPETSLVGFGSQLAREILVPGSLRKEREELEKAVRARAASAKAKIEEKERIRLDFEAKQEEIRRQQMEEEKAREALNVARNNNPQPRVVDANPQIEQVYQEAAARNFKQESAPALVYITPPPGVQGLPVPPPPPPGYVPKGYNGPLPPPNVIPQFLPAEGVPQEVVGGTTSETPYHPPNVGAQPTPLPQEIEEEPRSLSEEKRQFEDQLKRTQQRLMAGGSAPPPPGANFGGEAFGITGVQENKRHPMKNKKKMLSGEEKDSLGFGGGKRPSLSFDEVEQRTEKEQNLNFFG